MDSPKKILLTGASVAAVIVVGIFFYLRKRNRDIYDDDNQDELEFADLNANEDSVASAGQSVSKIQVPAHMVGSIIGREGSNIKQLRAEFGVRFNFERDPGKEKEPFDNEGSAATHRLLEIRGQRDKVRAAEQKINAIITGTPKYIKTEILVPQEACGRIIGKGGQNIRESCSISGAKIIVDRNEDNLLDNLRKVFISGTTVQVEYAKLLINEKVEEYKANKSKHLSKVLYDGKYHRGVKDRKFPTLSLPNTSEYFQVFISAIDTPNQFWVQLVTNDSAKLDQLTNEMSQFYGSLQPEEERLESGNIGDLCAASYDDDNLWYRACISKFNEDRTAQLFYIDFGDTGCVELDKMKSIRLAHKTLFAQAIQCYLPIKSVDDAWTEEAKEKFKTLTHCAQWIPIMAKILYMYKIGEEEVPVLHLVDTSQDEDIDIAAALIRDGHAAGIVGDEHHVRFDGTLSSAKTINSHDTTTSSNDHPKQLVEEDAMHATEVPSQNNESDSPTPGSTDKHAEILTDIETVSNVNTENKHEIGDTNDTQCEEPIIDEETVLPMEERKLLSESKGAISHQSSSRNADGDDFVSARGYGEERSQINRDDSNSLEMNSISHSILDSEVKEIKVPDLHDQITDVEEATTELLNHEDTVEKRFETELTSPLCNERTDLIQDASSGKDMASGSLTTERNVNDEIRISDIDEKLIDLKENDIEFVESHGDPEVKIAELASDISASDERAMVGMFNPKDLKTSPEIESNILSSEDSDLEVIDFSDDNKAIGRQSDSIITDVVGASFEETAVSRNATPVASGSEEVVDKQFENNGSKIEDDFIKINNESYVESHVTTDAGLAGRKTLEEDKSANISHDNPAVANGDNPSCSTSQLDKGDKIDAKKRRGSEGVIGNNCDKDIDDINEIKQDRNLPTALETFDHVDKKAIIVSGENIADTADFAADGSQVASVEISPIESDTETLTNDVEISGDESSTMKEGMYSPQAEIDVISSAIDNQSANTNKTGEANFEVLDNEKPLSDEDKDEESINKDIGRFSEDSDDDFIDIDLKRVDGTLTAFVSEQNLHDKSDDNKGILHDNDNEEELQRSLEKTSRKNVVHRSMELSRENLISMNDESDSDSFFSATSGITITDAGTDATNYDTVDDRVSSTSALSDGTFYSIPSKSSLNGSKQSLSSVNNPIQRRSLSARSLSASFEISHIDEKSDKVLSVEHILTSSMRNGKAGGVGKETAV